MTDRIVLYSGGALSWAAAMRTIERHGRDNVRLLFTDTSMEDEDLYRFLDDSERQLGVPLIRLKDGRTPWDVFNDEGMLGNARVDLCSRILKREVGQRWLAEHAPGRTLVFGIDWTESHRLDGLRQRYGDMGYTVEAPMCDPPYLWKAKVFEWMAAEGLTPPRLYAMGFSHNNCGGFCVRAGQSHFAHLLTVMPDRYAQHEAQENALRAKLGKDVAVMVDRRGGGPRRPLTMTTFREQNAPHDGFDFGGCGCFIDDVRATRTDGGSDAQ